MRTATQPMDTDDPDHPAIMAADNATAKIEGYPISHIARYVGLILVLVCFYYIGTRIRGNWQDLSAWRPGWFLLLACIAAILVYGGSSFLLSAGWYRLLQAAGHTPACHTAHIHSIYGRTQIAKYLPGNVFHFAGRHILGRQAGISHGALVAAALYEILGLISAASLLALAGMLLYQQSVAGFSLLQGLTLLAAGLTGALAIAIAAPYLARLKGFQLPARDSLQTLVDLVYAVAFYFVFFAIVGGLLALLAYFATPSGPAIDVGRVVMVFAVAWLAGYVIPGASAGIGVREAVITAALAPMLGEALSVALALVFRLITISGDVVYFLVASAIRPSGVRA